MVPDKLLKLVTSQAVTYLLVPSNKSSVSKTTTQTSQFTLDTVSVGLKSSRQSAIVTLVQFILIYVLLISVLIATSHSCTVKANCSTSLATTKLSVIAKEGICVLGTFQVESKVATQFILAFSVLLIFKFIAVCCAVETGFAVSAVLSTFQSPTSHLIRVTAPVFQATLSTTFTSAPVAIPSSLVLSQFTKAPSLGLSW